MFSKLVSILSSLTERRTGWTKLDRQEKTETEIIILQQCSIDRSICFISELRKLSLGISFTLSTLLLCSAQFKANSTIFSTSVLHFLAYHCRLFDRFCDFHVEKALRFNLHTVGVHLKKGTMRKPVIICLQYLSHFTFLCTELHLRLCDWCFKSMLNKKAKRCEYCYCCCCNFYCVFGISYYWVFFFHFVT